MTTWTLTAKATGSAECDHCGRVLKNVFTVTGSEGQIKMVGRGCLVNVTGWTVTEAEAKRLIRAAANAARWDAFAAANVDLAARLIADTSGRATEVRSLIATGGFGKTNILRRYLAGA